jgi:UDP:flavonoid glycosyltransferase YjiC (YdhE family)
VRIALATVGTRGDVAPFGVLARRLAERRHEVTAITWPVHRAALAQPGVRVEVAGPHADPARISAVAGEAAERSPIEQVAVLRDFHLADGEAHYRRLRTLLAGHDLVVLHGIHVLAHAAVLDADVRWATAVFDPVLVPTRAAPPPGMPNFGPLNAVAWWALDRVLARTGAPLEALLPRAGSAQRGLPLFRARSPRLHLLACSPSIIQVRTDFPVGTVVTGTWLDRDPPAPLEPRVSAFLGDGAAPIVLAFGSMAGAPAAEVDGAVRALLEAGRRVVAQPQVAIEISSPSLLRIGPMDHRPLFARAAAVVHHGGAGTTHAACAAGVPSVVVPHVGDQPYWGDRLHRIGVAAKALPVARLRAEPLAEAALEAATDPRLRERARQLATAMADEDGLARAVTEIESAAA